MSILYKKTEGGFTLIELLVVIAIIGILSSVVLASLNSARTKARDAKRVAEIKGLQTALEMAYDDNGQYPISSWTCSNQANWQTSALATALDPYMPTLPVDPTNGSGYAYNGALTYCYYANGYGLAGGWYMLVFRLENQNTKLDAQDGSTACNGRVFDYGGNDGYILTYGGSC